MVFQKTGEIGNLPLSENDSIFKQLIKLAIPITATSFLSIAYNLINLIFVGKLGSGAVAAVGSAGFFYELLLGNFFFANRGRWHKSRSFYRGA